MGGSGKRTQVVLVRADAGESGHVAELEGNLSAPALPEAVGLGPQKHGCRTVDPIDTGEAEMLGQKKNIVCSRIPDREAILGSIKEFLGTGR